MPAYFGLDIGTTSIKLIHIEGNKVKGMGIGANPVGKSVSSMTNAEKITLVDTLKSLVKDTGIKPTKVVASIAESAVFSRVMKFPFMSTPELSTAVKWELDQSVPFPPSDIETSWSVIDKPEKFSGNEKISVYVVAVPKTVSETYAQMMELVGLEPERLENEIPALNRVFGQIIADDFPAAVLDFGASGTNIVISGKNKIFNSFYVPVGGAALTRLIAEAFNLPLGQAENYKRTYGLSKNQLDGKMVGVLKPVIDNIIGELNKLMISYKEENPDSAVGRLILTGGGAYLVGLLSYLSESLGGIEVVIGDPFVDKDVEAKYKSLGPVFAIASGLSM